MEATTAPNDTRATDALRSRLEEQVRHLRRQLDELQENTLHHARHAARTADRTVQEHPYSAIGVAAAAGLLLGFLLARR
jgi:ElaB/YqjD/DUF883 family membrane-anchored ribosome-binding protein